MHEDLKEHLEISAPGLNIIRSRHVLVSSRLLEAEGHAIRVQLMKLRAWTMFYN